MPVTIPPDARIVWKGQIYKALEWEQELFDGSKETFECVVRQDSTTVISFIDPQTVIITKQEQPGRTPFMDVPGGRVDEGEDCLRACQRELEEETGYKADENDWTLWKRRLHEGGIRYEETLYIARNAKKVNGGHADAGERIEVIATPWDKAIELCLQSKLRQPAVMHAILCMQFDPEEKKRLTDWLSAN